MDGDTTAATAQGHREHQEDRHVVVRVEDGWLLAVFDGHGGDGASERGAAVLEEVFTRSRESAMTPEGTLEATVAGLAKATEDERAGSTVSLVWIREAEQDAVVAVLGDSPVLVRGANGEVRVGPVHNTILNPEDAQRAMDKGASMVGPYLVNPGSFEGVNLTRSIGDAELPFVGKTPVLYTVDLGEDAWVVVASDGLHGPEHPTPEDLAPYVQERIEAGDAAEDLVRDALDRGSDDNVTVVVWRAQPNGT